MIIWGCVSCVTVMCESVSYMCYVAGIHVVALASKLIDDSMNSKLLQITQIILELMLNKYYKTCTMEKNYGK